MKRLAAGALLALAMLALTACAGSASYGSAKDVAERIGCSGFATRPGPLLSFTVGQPWWESGDDPLVPRFRAVRFESGACTYHGSRLRIMWASEPGVLDTYYFDLGPTPAHPDRVLSGSTWVVHCDTAAACLALQRTTGARIGRPSVSR